MAVKIEACVSEFVGTFFLVLTIGYNVLQHTALAPISIGAMLMAMIFATGKVSGGHFNPAVTLGVLMRGKIDSTSALAYVASQLCGGLLAGSIYIIVLGATFTLAPGHGYSIATAFCAEMLFSTALVFVVLSVATTAQDDGNWYYGLAIGFTVMAAAFAIGPISGCSLNPAVTSGVMLSHLIHTGDMVVSHFLAYIVAPLIGSMIAVLLFRIVRSAEYEVRIPTGDDPRDIEYLVDGLETKSFSANPDRTSPLSPTRTQYEARDLETPSGKIERLASTGSSTGSFKDFG